MRSSGGACRGWKRVNGNCQWPRGLLSMMRLAVRVDRFGWWYGRWRQELGKLEAQAFVAGLISCDQSNGETLQRLRHRRRVKSESVQRRLAGWCGASTSAARIMDGSPFGRVVLFRLDLLDNMVAFGMTGVADLMSRACCIPPATCEFIAGSQIDGDGQEIRRA